MKTAFDAEALANPHIASSSPIFQACVHCGMCTSTCPSYQILGDELDGPRGRIYLIKSMFEDGREPDADIVSHIDRCLSCLACTTTCPSGVDYMHLIDTARAHIHENYRRPLADRFLRGLLRLIVPYPSRFRLAMRAARFARPFAPLLRAGKLGARMRAMLELAPATLPKRDARDVPQIHAAMGERKKRVAILSGCAQPVLDPKIQRATISLLGRLGVEVIDSPEAGCCGALVHHMGREEAAREAARKNIRAWLALEEDGPIDAIIITTSGCGTTIKDYGHLLKGDELGEAAAKIAALACDVSEFLEDLFPECEAPETLRIAYHAPCSLQHGQKITGAPRALLRRAGFEIVEPFEAHLCCGSAGTYNMLEPEIAGALGRRKAEHLEALGADVIATSNIGCMTQIGRYSDTPIVHMIELLNWAAGGEKPAGLRGCGRGSAGA